MTEKTPAPRVFIVDSGALWLESLAAWLSREGFTIIGTAAGDPIDVETLADADVILVEPKTGSPEYLHDLVERARPAQVVALSSDDSPKAIEEALTAGAAGYVLKSMDPADLITALRLSASESAFAFIPRGAFERALPRDASVGLTPRQLEILRLTAEGKSNAEVAAALWVTEQTVKFHLKNIFRKLGVRNRTQATQWALAQGLLRTHSGAAEPPAAALEST